MPRTDRKKAGVLTLFACLLVVTPSVGAMGAEPPRMAPRPELDTVVQPLRGTLDDERANIRVKAACALVDLGHVDDQVIDVLARALVADDPSNVTTSLRGLAQLGPRVEPALPALMRLLEHGQPEHTELAISVIAAVGRPVIPEVRKLLSHEDRVVRFRAVWLADELGYPAHQLTEQLIEMLDEEDLRLRAAVIEAVGRIGRAVRKADADAARALRYADWEDKEQRRQIFAQIGSDGADALVDAVLGNRLLPDRQYNEIQTALTRIGRPAIPACLRLWHSGHEDAVTGASALAQMGGLAAPAVAPLLASADQFELEDVKQFYDGNFDSPKFGLLWTLTNTLLLVGSHDVEAVRRALQAEKSTVRFAAATAFNERCLSAWDELVHLFDDPEALVRRSAVQCMAKLGKEAAPALPRLRQMLTDEDPEIRRLATRAIGYLGDAGGRAAPDVAQRLHDEEDSVRSAAAESLVRLGTPGLDALRTLLRSDREVDRLRALEAVVGVRQQHYVLSKLQERGDGTVLADVARTLDDSRAPVRTAAVRAVHAMLEGLRFADSVTRAQSQAKVFELVGDRVVELAADGHTHTRAEAIPLLAVCWEKLSEEKGQIQRALSAIAAGCRDERPEVRRVALLALAKMRKLPGGVLERLLAGLDDEHPDVRAAAAQALWAFFYGCDPETNVQLSGTIYLYPPPNQGPVDIQKTVRKLTARLSDKHAQVRLNAAKALQVFVGDAQTALPALRKLEQDPDPEIRKAAAETIEWVEKDGHYCGAVYARLPSPGGYELPKTTRR